jgi:hypothetical protein
MLVILHALVILPLHVILSAAKDDMKGQNDDEQAPDDLPFTVRPARHPVAP